MCTCAQGSQTDFTSAHEQLHLNRIVFYPGQQTQKSQLVFTVLRWLERGDSFGFTLRKKFHVTI